MSKSTVRPLVRTSSLHLGNSTHWVWPLITIQTTAPAHNARELKEDWEPAFDPDPVHVRNVPGLLNLVENIRDILGIFPKAIIVIAQTWWAEKSSLCPAINWAHFLVDVNIETLSLPINFNEENQQSKTWSAWSPPCWCLGRQHYMQTLIGTLLHPEKVNDKLRLSRGWFVWAI